MTNDKALEYFESVIIAYNCGDIKALLERKLPQAGPLLACVVNGIDAMGGIIYGFDKEIGGRSKEFMNKFMGYDPVQADFLYTIVRCGMAHECAPKAGLAFFALYDEVDGEVLYRGDDGGPWLNVVQLAKEYLKAVEDVRTSAQSRLQDPPKFRCRDRRIFNSVDFTKLPGIDILERLVLNKDGEPQRQLLAQRAISSLSSYSPFDKKRLNLMKLPPEES